MIRGITQYNLPIIQNIMDEIYHETTEFTPMELHFIIKPTRFWERYIKSIMENHKECTHENKLAMESNKMHSKLKKRADRKNQGIEHNTLMIRETVLVKTLPVSNLLNKQIAKFFHIYEGPYQVSQQTGMTAMSFLIKNTIKHEDDFTLSY